MKKKVRFSIITVVKNDRKNIEKTIKSVLQNSFKDFEYIIIDGRSNDGTVEKINSFKIDYFSSAKDKNLWDGINKGIRKSNGQILFVLNSGDILYRNGLKIADKYFNNYDIDFLFGAIKKDRIFISLNQKNIFLD